MAQRRARLASRRLDEVCERLEEGTYDGRDLVELAAIRWANRPGQCSADESPFGRED